MNEFKKKEKLKPKKQISLKSKIILLIIGEIIVSLIVILVVFLSER